MKKYIFLAFIFAVMSCSSNREGYFTDEQKASVRADSASVVQNNVDSHVDIDLSKYIASDDPVYFNELIDTVKFVILDDSKSDALVGNIYRILFSDKYIYIKDDVDGNSVVIFDINGKFVKRIQGGNGPGEISTAYDIKYDKFNNKLLVSVPRGIAIYEENGDYIKTEILPLQFADFECTENGYLCWQAPLTYNEHLHQHQGNCVLYVSRDIKLKWSALPHYNYTPFGVGYCYNKILNTPEGSVLPDAFHDTIYGLDENGVFAKYVINLGSDKLPYEYYSNKEMAASENFNIIFNSSRYIYLSNYLETTTHQYFHVRYTDRSSASYIFRDKQSGNAIGGKIIKVNPYELPEMVDPYIVSGDWFVLPCGMPGGWQFTSPLVSSQDNDRMSKLGEEANPVIVLFKLKHF